MKKIITHLNPDLDAVVSVWLIKRFLPASPNRSRLDRAEADRGELGWGKAAVEFIGAGVSKEKQKGVDEDPNVLYVDVGRGKLDHHQTGEYLSAAKLCLEYVKEKRKGQQLSPLEEKALEEIVAVTTEVDNARDLAWKEINEARYHFYLSNLIDGLRGLAKSDGEVINSGLKMMEAVLFGLKQKIRAEEELREGFEFKVSWGKAVAVESGNKYVTWWGEAKGYVLVVKKDPEKGGVRIVARPDSTVDLTEAFRKLKEKDPDSDWFLHAGKKMLLNQASVDPKMRPTKLSLKEVIEVLEKT